MAHDGKVVISTKLDKSDFENGLNKMQAIAKKGFGAVASAIGVATGAITALIGAGVKYNAEMEKYQTALTTLTGSAEEASKIMEQIKKDAASTPFDVQGLTQANQLLISAGVSSDQARKDIINLGNAISATGGGNDELSRMAVNLQQIKNVGKATALDIKQFAYAGIDIYGLLADSMGVTREEATELDVTYEMLTDALAHAGEEGGRYFGAMEAQSKTLNGQISNLQDNFGQLTGVIANDATNAISGEFLPAINDMIQAMQEGFEKDGMQGLAEAFSTGITNLLVQVVNHIPDLIEAGSTLLSALVTGISENSEQIITSILTAIELLINAILDNLPLIMELGMKLIIQLMLGIAEKAPDLVPQIIDCIIKMMEVFNEHFDEFMMAGIKIILGIIEGLIKSIPNIIKNLPTIIMAIINFFTLSKFLTIGKSIISGMGKGLINNIPDILKKIPQVITNIINTFKNGGFSSVGKYIVEGIWSGLSGSLSWIKNKITGWVGNVLKFIKKLFGIHSPSTVMRDEIGEFLGEGTIIGFTQGFDDNISEAFDDIQKTMDLEASKVNANVETGAIYNKIMNPIPLNINNNNRTTLELDGEKVAEVVNEVNEKKDLQYGF